MYREFGARLRAAMREKGVDALVLLGNGNVVYATGASWPLLDAGLSHVERPVAVVLADDEHPHLYMPFREGSSFESELPADHVHGPLYLEFDEGVEHFATILGRPGARGRHGGGRRADRCDAPRRDAAVSRGSALGCRTGGRRGQAGQDRRPDLCIRKACRITEQAVAEVQKSLAPGVRQIDLSAQFVRRAFELGATANMLEAIWQVMPTTRASGRVDHHRRSGAAAADHRERSWPRATCCGPTSASPTRGTARTSGAPGWSARSRRRAQQAQFAKWREILDAVLAVTKAGATCGDLARAAIAANGGAKPWLPHFYLGHGIGTNAAEMPMIGTDLGQEFDDNFVFPAGMVLVLEPVVWEDGTGGYRSEEIVVITEDGYQSITDYPYAPYGHGQ